MGFLKQTYNYVHYSHNALLLSYDSPPWHFIFHQEEQAKYILFYCHDYKHYSIRLNWCFTIFSDRLNGHFKWKIVLAKLYPDFCWNNPYNLIALQKHSNYDRHAPINLNSCMKSVLHSNQVCILYSHILYLCT